MKIFALVLVAAFVQPQIANAQFIYVKDHLFSAYAIQNKQAQTRKERILLEVNELAHLPIAPDEDTCEPIEISLAAISQFMIRTPQSDSGIQRLVTNYNSLTENAQRALLEVLYGLYPNQYRTEVSALLQHITSPKNFAIASLYIHRARPESAIRQLINQLAAKLSCSESQAVMVNELLSYLNSYQKHVPLPPIDSLFSHQKTHGYKMIYSFQRKNRNYAGLAIIQNADGSFVKDTAGRVKTFSQLARSASNLPYFITNGSTPQGLYSITGTDVSKGAAIGPTPNLQMVMLSEAGGPVFAHYNMPVSNATPEQLYRFYFPANWQNWDGILEAYRAGKIGRSEIIAHGSTIDPEWYKGYPFYPLTPTMGCLCSPEKWDIQTGKLVESQQLDLVNAYLATNSAYGFLMVIDLDDKAAPVSTGEVEKLVRQFEEK